MNFYIFFITESDLRKIGAIVCHHVAMLVGLLPRQ